MRIRLVCFERVLDYGEIVLVVFLFDIRSKHLLEIVQIVGNVNYYVVLVIFQFPFEEIGIDQIDYGSAIRSVFLVAEHYLHVLYGDIDIARREFSFVG